MWETKLPRPLFWRNVYKKKFFRTLLSFLAPRVCALILFSHLADHLIAFHRAALFVPFRSDFTTLNSAPPIWKQKTKIKQKCLVILRTGFGCTLIVCWWLASIIFTFYSLSDCLFFNLDCVGHRVVHDTRLVPSTVVRRLNFCCVWFFRRLLFLFFFLYRWSSH